jgi:hypothetical protein
LPTRLQPDTTLLNAIREQPQLFNDKRIYVCIYRTRFNERQIRLVAEEKEAAKDKQIDAVGWKVPTDANLICFYINNHKMKFDDFWARPAYEWKSAGPSPIYFMRRLRDLNGISKIGRMEEWAEAVLSFANKILTASSDEADHLELGEFYDLYLREVEPKTKILNVLDKRHRLTSVADGKFESGFWYKPNRECDIIRVFDEPNGKSIRGGRIVSDRIVNRRGNKTKVFLFVDDASQHGKAPPSRFQENGCAASLEPIQQNLA